MMEPEPGGPLVGVSLFQTQSFIANRTTTIWANPVGHESYLKIRIIVWMNLWILVTKKSIFVLIFVVICFLEKVSLSKDKALVFLDSLCRSN